jgi:uncharacterized lipoprotein YddW (UPF0748 family)
MPAMSRGRGLLVSLLLVFCAACGSPAQVAKQVKEVPILGAVVPAQPAPVQEPPVIPSGPAELRGLWVDGFHQGFKSPKQVDTLIARARKANLNALFVQMRKRGDAYFLRGVEPEADDVDYPNHPNWDPLAYLIQKAHTANPPMQVHAWMNTFYVGQSSQVWQDYSIPWGDIRYSGTNDGYGYLDPGVPAVRAYTEEVMTEVVRHYNVDGIHLDLVRYPDGGDWGYSPTALALYAKASGSSARPQPDDPAWQDWRRQQVTTFVHELHDKIQSIRPRVKLSGALIAYGAGPKSDSDWLHSRTYTEVYQDWATWLRNGYLDFGVPMNYDRDSSPKQQGWFRDWISWEKKSLGAGKVLIGVGAFLNYPEDTMAQIRAGLAPSVGGARPLGVAIYSYASTSLYGTDDFYLAPLDQGYLPRQPYAPNTDPKYLSERAAQFNEWFYTALSEPSSYQDPALGKVATTPVFLKPAPLP